MMPLQREGTLVIQNRTSKIARAKVGVTEIVKYIRARLPRANEFLITGDRVLEMTLGKLFVCLCKLGIRLREGWCGHEKRECRRNNCTVGGSRPPGAMPKAWRLRRSIFIELGELDPPCASFHFRFSINSSTSRRFSGEILPGPLWAPLYCHSSLCSKRRRNWSRE